MLLKDRLANRILGFGLPLAVTCQFVKVIDGAEGVDAA